MIGFAILLLAEALAQAQPAPAVSQASTLSVDVVLPGRVLGDGTEGNPEDVVFKVNGAPVTRKEWRELVEFRRTAAPKMVLPPILRTAVRDLARHRAVLMHYEGRAKELQPRLDQITAKIEELKTKCGSDRNALLAGFGALCNEFSDDPTVRGPGRDGRINTIMRGQVLYPLDYIVFTSPVGAITQPMPTVQGYEILLIEEVRKGAMPMMDVSTPRRLLVSWDPSTRKFAKQADAILSEAKIEIVDPVFQQIVPPGLVLGPGVPFPAEEAAREPNPRFIKVEGYDEPKSDDQTDGGDNSDGGDGGKK